jgi:phosphatidylserine/phosphatidylglycerophosphate/cardiolipin synthase-like enzyme
MHNKFMIIDANSPDANDPLVWTGSCNWTELQFNTSYNNVIIVQDQALARNYLKEFNQMWGDTGLTPNLTLSKFGPFKANITSHSFMVGSTRVENYFSPSDGVNTEILNAANTANKELFFGVYTFTRGDIAGAIATRYRSPGYTVKGIIDVNSQNTAYQAYDTLYPLMGANMRVYTSTGVYHNKMMIVDPDYPSSDPLVLTGSHNWSTTANTTNDENTLIVHDADIANQYLQSFAQNFIDLGGSISPVNTGIEDDSEADAIRLYPNPTNDKVYLSVQDATEPIEVAISDLSGQVLSTQTIEPSSPELSLQPYENGIYLIKLTISGRTQVYRIIKM